MSGNLIFSPKEMLSKVKETFKNEELLKVISSTRGKDIVMFLGSTGVGKSTSLNYLAGCDMIENDEEKIVVSEQSKIKPISNIGHSDNKSETFIPLSYQKDSLAYYDCPGLDDTEGITQRIINAKLIKELAKNAKSVRLSVFFRKSILIDRGAKDLIQSAFNAIKSLFISAKENPLTVFVTQLQGKKPETLKERIKENIVTSTDFKEIKVEFVDPLNTSLRESFDKSLQDLKPLKDKAVKIPLGDRERLELQSLLESEYKMLEEKWGKIRECLIRDCENYLLAPSIPEEELSQRLKQVDELIKQIEQLKQTTENNVKPYSKTLNVFRGSGDQLKQQLLKVQKRYVDVAKEIEELMDINPFTISELVNLKGVYESGMLKLKSIEAERAHKEEMDRQQRESAKEMLELVERQRKEDTERMEREIENSTKRILDLITSQRKEDMERIDKQRKEDIERMEKQIKEQKKDMRYQLEREKAEREKQLKASEQVQVEKINKLQEECKNIEKLQKEHKQTTEKDCKRHDSSISSHDSRISSNYSTISNVDSRLRETRKVLYDAGVAWHEYNPGGGRGGEHALYDWVAKTAKFPDEIYRNTPSSWRS